MAGHVWKKIGSNQRLWMKSKYNREQHWRIRKLKESAHLFGTDKTDQ